MKLNEYIEITNEDNMELMARYPDKYFDLSIVDPPYGIGFDGHNTITKEGHRGFSAKKKLHDKKNWDNERPSNEYFEELRRVSKNQIVWGGNYFADLLPPKKGWIFWDKKITNANNKNFSDGELAWTSFDCILRRFTYDWIGFGYLNNPQGEKKTHPTQKPVALYAWILKNYAKQGEKILDTHLGSGSIACAVHNANSIDKMDLSLVACELDKDYFESSIQRVKAALQTQSLF